MDIQEFKRNASERLREFIHSNKISQVSFAKKIGVKQSTLSAILSKGGGLSSDLINGIIEKYPDLNWNWIYKGTGCMVDTMQAENDAPKNIVNIEADVEDNDLLIPYQALLDEKDRRIEELRKDKERLWSLLETLKK